MIYTITNYLLEVNTDSVTANTTLVQEDQTNVPAAFQLPGKCVAMELDGKMGNCGKEAGRKTCKKDFFENLQI